jgi:hypothetical protein
MCLGTLQLDKTGVLVTFVQVSIEWLSICVLQYFDSLRNLAATHDRSFNHAGEVMLNS